MDINLATIYLERIDQRRNMARFYQVSVEIDLFGDILAVRRWGRIGSDGRRVSFPQQSVTDALCEVKRCADDKRRRGYRNTGRSTAVAVLHSMPAPFKAQSPK
ncbi:WGR domain-containing protein [Rhizobium sp. CFBP 8752]|uniref:WGR domain-containing protein n=1 Tax=Rhizobium sp. CFBP 8752 TaxID=2775301 RepID=UPI001785A560|nr:WGR domain-containing protein [Rhizobium sp. CFBP 8752]MBD8665883.1 WGR domain-containing protein [Rhizobium sp. CFBP 8752]